MLLQKLQGLAQELRLTQQHTHTQMLISLAYPVAFVEIQQLFSFKCFWQAKRKCYRHVLPSREKSTTENPVVRGEHQ